MMKSKVMAVALIRTATLLLGCLKAIQANGVDVCDWTGSGPAAGGVVTPVYLGAGCSAGRVAWTRPDRSSGGALRLVLRHPAAAAASQSQSPRQRQPKTDGSTTDVWTGGLNEDDNDSLTPLPPPLVAADEAVREFRACVLVHNYDAGDNDVTAQGGRSQRRRRTSEDEKRRNFPARLFLEGTRSLVPLYTADDGGGATSVRCFRSKGGRAAIYMEPDQLPTDAGGSGDSNHGGERRHSPRLGGQTSQQQQQQQPREKRKPQRRSNNNRPRAVIDYELQSLDDGTASIWDECRPCDEREMARAYCQSERVYRGVIVGVEHSPELDSSELLVRVTRRLRGDRGDRGDNAVTMTSHGQSSAVTSSSPLTLERVQAPSACGGFTGTRDVERVFMTSRRLGHAAVRCVATLREWARVVLSSVTSRQRHTRHRHGGHEKEEMCKLEA